MTTDYNNLVVSEIQTFMDQYPDSAIYNQCQGGMKANASEEEQLKVAEEYENYLNQFNTAIRQRR